MKKGEREWRNKPLAVFLIFVLALALAGCGGKSETEVPAVRLTTEEPPAANTAGEETPGTSEAQPPKTAEAPAPKTQEPSQEPAQEPSQEPAPEPSPNPAQGEAAEPDGFSFAQLENLGFSFLSGAGAWSTELTIHGDGSFDGVFSDSDMGDTGEGYPNGTLYFCRFSGQFAPPEKADDYTYSTRIEQIRYENEAGTQEIIDDTLYVYSGPYGLEDAQEILIYLPGTPLDGLSEEFLLWMHLFHQETELPFYALNNTVYEEGFTSYDILENVRTYVGYTQEDTARMEESLAEDNLDQAKIDEISQNLFLYWDTTLNRVWDDLNRVKDEAFLSGLSDQQRAWTAWRDAQAQAAGAAIEDGAAAASAANRKAAELTRDRVYELLELFE